MQNVSVDEIKKLKGYKKESPISTVQQNKDNKNKTGSNKPKSQQRRSKVNKRRPMGKQ